MNNMNGLLRKLKQLLSRHKRFTAEHASGPDTARTLSETKKTTVLNEEAIVELMQQLKQTQEGQFSCADSYALLDEYVDLIADNEQAELLMPFVKAHIEACPDCHQEFEILLEILQSDE